MANKLLTVPALVAAGFAGGLIFRATGETVQVIPDTAARTELTGSEATAVLIDEAGRARQLEGSMIRCKPGVFLDGVFRSDKEWCSDGAGQTWVRDAVGEETLRVVGGSVYREAR